MEKMREEFETWFCSTIPYPISKESWFAIMDDGDYIITDVQAAWAGWKASREALCVELPDSKNDYQSSSYYEDGWLKGFNHCLDEVSSILDSDGVQYK